MDCLRKAIVERDIKYEDINISKESEDLLKKLLQTKSERRITWDNLIDHKWFSEVMYVNNEGDNESDEEEHKEQYKHRDNECCFVMDEELEQEEYEYITEQTPSVNVHSFIISPYFKTK